MGNATWLTFCVSNAVTRTSIHFFPSADNVTAPYPANCALTLFGGGGEMRSIVLEGARLSNPDGLRVDDAFPELKAETSGLFALAVELSCPQQSRLNLSGSGCVMELNSHGYCCRFWPKSLELKNTKNERAGLAQAEKVEGSPVWPVSGIALRDSIHQASLVVVNGSQKGVRLLCAGKMLSSADQEQAVEPNAFAVEVHPESVIEASIAPEYFEKALSQECSWGFCKAASLVVAPAKEQQFSVRDEGVSAGGQNLSKQLEGSSEQPMDTAVSCYMVYRDSNSKRIVSVTALK